MELQKAFDFKVLGAELKALLKIEAEDDVKKALILVDKFMLKSIEIENNTLVKGVVQVGWGYLKPKLDEAAEKIS